MCVSRGVRKPFGVHAWMYVPTRARGRAVRAYTRGCVGACNAREMRRTTIQILLLLLREQSPVNRPPRHNVSIQVRSAVLNRSGSYPSWDSRKSTLPRTTREDCRRLCDACRTSSMSPSNLRCGGRWLCQLSREQVEYLHTLCMCARYWSPNENNFDSSRDHIDFYM